MLQLELLWKLNCIDHEIGLIKKESKDKEVFNRLNEIKSEYADIKKEFDKETEEIKQNEKIIKKLSDELKNIEDKIKDCNLKLYMNGQSLKMIDSMQKEIEINSIKKDKLENELLNLMERNEKLIQSTAQNKKKLLDYKEEVETMKKRYMEKMEANNKAIEELDKKRLEVIKEVDDKLLKLYNDIATKKQNPVSAVRDGICSECGVKLNALKYDMLKKDESLQRCDYCGRILYLE